MQALWGKIREALQSALPITAIVYLSALLPGVDLGRGELLAFTASAVLLVVGLGLFGLGADLAMTPMGTHVGAGISRQKKIGLLLAVCFALGMLITVAEPDLKVLAGQVGSVMSGSVLTYAVGAGVGLFLLVAVARIVFRRELSGLLMLFYMILFGLALVLAVSGKEDLLCVAFDSGGVTTGPITVPFLMALGVGVSSVLGDRRSQENSFGLVALCSVGPVLAVLVLSLFARGELRYAVPDYTIAQDFAGSLCATAGHIAREVAVALGLIAGSFLLCQAFFLKLPWKQLRKLAVGIVFTYIGLVMFLTGVESGFMPIGYRLGASLASGHPVLLIAVGTAMGVLVVLAEPAIHVLNEQVEDVTGGFITRRSMGIALCTGVGLAIGLSMVRIVFDFSLIYYVVPGYVLSLALSLFVPPVYTAVAFDSGGVASGPMTSGFILPFAVGACVRLQGADAVLRDAFGVVALVAMTPLITIQLLGFRGIAARKVSERRAMRRILDADDDQIIQFL